MQKQAQSLAEEMNKAERHTAYTWLSEQWNPLLTDSGGVGFIASSLQEVMSMGNGKWPAFLHKFLVSQGM